jgi:hypothetical protein
VFFSPKYRRLVGMCGPLLLSPKYTGQQAMCAAPNLAASPYMAFPLASLRKISRRSRCSPNTSLQQLYSSENMSRCALALAEDITRSLLHPLSSTQHCNPKRVSPKVSGWIVMVSSASSSQKEAHWFTCVQH